MPSKEKTAPDCNQEAAQEVQRTRIIPPLGACINCGSRIALVGGATSCPTCSAWKRWYSAQRIASGYLRGVTQ